MPFGIFFRDDLTAFGAAGIVPHKIPVEILGIFSPIDLHHKKQAGIGLDSLPDRVLTVWRSIPGGLCCLAGTWSV
jgi:hypothetical protein